jgi:hypothetical protein
MTPPRQHRKERHNQDDSQYDSQHMRLLFVTFRTEDSMATSSDGLMVTGAAFVSLSKIAQWGQHTFGPAAIAEIAQESRKDERN